MKARVTTIVKFGCVEGGVGGSNAPRRASVPYLILPRGRGTVLSENF